jgi:hypothetical protein
MPNKGKHIASPRHKVVQNVSPDDIKVRLMEVEARQRADTRTPAQVWLGDPPPGRSALTQRMRGAAS